MTSRSWLLELKWSDTSFSVKWIWKVNGIKWNSLHNTRPEQVIYVTDEEVIVNAKETNWSLMDEFLAASEPEMLLNTLHLWIASVFWVECLHCTVLIVSTWWCGHTLSTACLLWGAWIIYRFLPEICQTKNRINYKESKLRVMRMNVHFLCYQCFLVMKVAWFTQWTKQT